MYKIRTKTNAGAAIAAALNIEPAIADFLISRGIDTSEKADKFLNFKEEYLRNPRNMKDGEKVISHIANAIRNKNNIVIYGDYDGDGVMATAIMVWAMRWFGIEPHYFINNRFKEGYGLGLKGMERMIKENPGVQTVITVDNGIAAIEGVDYANSLGIEVIVTDHHLAKSTGELPKASGGVLCEKRPDEDFDVMEEFCGAELARRVMCEVAKELGVYNELKEKFDQLYAFAAFAEISDVINLGIPANHYVTKRGLELIVREEFPCWTALRLATKTTYVDETTIGYKYAPMINAAGRMLGDAIVPLKLIISRDIEEAKEAASRLVELNEKRKEITHTEEANASKQVKENKWDEGSCIVVSGNYHEGINGLIAAELVKVYGLPSICLCPTDEDPSIYKGSARSVGDFNIKVALDKCADLLLGYGGHKGAAGLSLKKENIEELRKRLNEVARQEQQEQEQYIDFYVKPEELSYKEFMKYRESLAPFGSGFEKPLYCISGVCDFASIVMMKNVHLKFKMTSNSETPCIWFNGSEKFKNMGLADTTEISAIGVPSVNSFNNTISLQFIVDDIVRTKELNR